MSRTLIENIRLVRSGRTTKLFFIRHRGPRPFPRWSVQYTDPAAPNGLYFRTFRTKLGCRIHAWRLGRIPGWLR